MVKVTKTRRSEVKESMFDALSKVPMTQAVDPNAPEAPKPEEDRIASLLQQVGALQNEVEDMRRYSAAVAQPAPRAEPAPKQDSQALPDPINDPQGYANALLQRVDNSLKSRADADKEARERAQAEDNRYSGLWENFTEAYEEIAAHPEAQDRVKFISQKVVAQAKAKGLDPERYMFGNQSRFFKDVAAQYEKTFGKPEQETEDEGDTGRTAGVFGGTASGGRPSGTGQQQQQQAQTGMTKELHKIQKEMGLF